MAVPRNSRNRRNRSTIVATLLRAILCCFAFANILWLWIACEFASSVVSLDLPGLREILQLGGVDDSDARLLKYESNKTALELNYTDWNASWLDTESPTGSPTTSPSVAPSASPSSSPTEYHIRERPAVDIPIYVAIASVPRLRNLDYLIRVLDSLIWAQFPLQNVYVFFNGDRNQTHMRWNEGFYLYSNLGIHFLWNEMPEPPIHPAVFNASVPLPANVSEDDEEVRMAMLDAPSRKRWRHKECSDFRAISKHMLSVVDKSRHDNGGNPENDPWVIFNQDDGQWIKTFKEIFPILMINKDIVDFHGEGMVSIGFQTGRLAALVEYGELWCDFKPVDWMMWEFTRVNQFVLTKLNKAVNHIGKVSSREGRVSDPPTQKPTPAPTSEPAKTSVTQPQVISVRAELKTVEVTQGLVPVENVAKQIRVDPSLIQGLVDVMQAKNQNHITFWSPRISPNELEAVMDGNGTITVFERDNATDTSESNAQAIAWVGQDIESNTPSPKRREIIPTKISGFVMTKLKEIFGGTNYTDLTYWDSSKEFAAHKSEDGNITVAQVIGTPEDGDDAPTEGQLDQMLAQIKKRHEAQLSFSVSGGQRYLGTKHPDGVITMVRIDEHRRNDPFTVPPSVMSWPPFFVRIVLMRTRGQALTEQIPPTKLQKAQLASIFNLGDKFAALWDASGKKYIAEKRPNGKIILGEVVEDNEGDTIEKDDDDSNKDHTRTIPPDHSTAKSRERHREDDSDNGSPSMPIINQPPHLHHVSETDGLNQSLASQSYTNQNHTESQAHGNYTRERLHRLGNDTASNFTALENLDQQSNSSTVFEPDEAGTNGTRDGRVHGRLETFVDNLISQRTSKSQIEPPTVAQDISTKLNDQRMVMFGSSDEIFPVNHSTPLPHNPENSTNSSQWISFATPMVPRNDSVHGHTRSRSRGGEISLAKNEMISFSSPDANLSKTNDYQLSGELTSDVSDNIDQKEQSLHDVELEDLTDKSDNGLIIVSDVIPQPSNSFSSNITGHSSMSSDVATNASATLSADT